VGVRDAECRRINLGFLRAVTQGLPEVTLKAAITLDGRIADSSGESRWITGPVARECAHRLRDTHDAVVVGVGTILADNPRLTTRLPGGRDAVPVVLDTDLRMSSHAAILTAGRRPLVFCAEDAVGVEHAPADTIRVPRAPVGVDIRSVLRVLAGRGHHRVLVEGGSKVHRSFLDAGIVDRLELFVNARVLAAGPGFVGGPGFRLGDAPGFSFVSCERVGADLHVVLERTPTEG
jgi:diaminohydroxyphosphoribosylaminopyrimidine deaminase/5-amino-6-(5-phosphoribosylamino)uracil reductase